MSTNDGLLSVENFRVAYPLAAKNFQMDDSAQWAVDGVSFAMQPGDRLGLVGESGCGKSTLGRAIMRLLPPGTQTEGQVNFAGRSVLSLSPEELRRFRGEVVSLVFQDPMTRLNPLLTIGDHCLETLRSHRPNLSRHTAKERVIEALEAVKIPASRFFQYPHEFSGGMRQRVAIALALLLNPRLIVADEPTTSLDVTVAAQILQELTRLCAERQMALLVISHNLAMIGQYCDRLAVMYQGKLVETGTTQQVMTAPQHSYTRSLLQAALHVRASVPSNSQAVTIQPLLRLQSLRKHYVLEKNLVKQLWSRSSQVIKAVDDINLEIYPGETLGLVGESGCGKSTLSRTILQLIRPSAGKVEFLGQDLTQLRRHALQRQRRQMQMVFQDPHACLNPRMTIGDSIADPLRVHQLGTPQEIRSRVLAMLERVRLIPAESFYQRYPSELSGGQQQRVAIARALITQPQLVICDEPVSMLDATVQHQVLALMAELKRDFNLTYLFITHDLAVARFFCDRIAVMTAGQIVELADAETLFTHPQHPYTRSLLQAAPILNLHHQ